MVVAMVTLNSSNSTIIRSIREETSEMTMSYRAIQVTTATPILPTTVVPWLMVVADLRLQEYPTTSQGWKTTTAISYITSSSSSNLRNLRELVTQEEVPAEREESCRGTLDMEASQLMAMFREAIREIPEPLVVTTTMAK
jgi:hypothetical protein